MLPYLIAGAIGYGIAKLLEDDKAPKYADGGSVLLAPNGKPSNLTPEQYKLVREPAFKKWFGDWENDPANASKVIDENGEPLVVLHGTNNEVNIFKKSKNKSYANNVFGFFFTTQKWIANSYGKNINYCFLNLKNLITLNETDFQIHLNYKNWDDNLKTLKEYKKNKLDGIFYTPNIYVAFEPNQIKLADGSNTTFDGNNPDIRFAGGGEARPFTDDGNKYVVFNQYRNYNPYKIAVDDVNDANYITLWKTNTNTGIDKKVGYLRLYKTPDNFLSVSETSIDRGNKGLGLGLEMYKIALKYSSDEIKGIKSYLPNRTNKKQVPKIYRKLNSVKEGDWDIIYKQNNPDIRFNGGGKLADNIFDYFIKIKGLTPLGNQLWEKSNCTIKIDFSNVLNLDKHNRVWLSPIEYNDYKKAFTILEFHCRDKNKGVGTAVLEEIIQGADLFGFTIFIEPTSMKKYRVETDINTDDLKRWYSKYDFKPLNNNYSDYVWLRNPNNPDVRYAGGGSVEELKFSNEIESDAMGYDIGDYLYHITPVSNFDTIINKGFIPKNGISINGKPFENRLYFATSLISAYDLSVNFGSYRDDTEYVIFKIKSDCIDDYEEDNLFAHGIYVDYKISNKCILGYVNANDLFNKFDDEDLENLYY